MLQYFLCHFNYISPINKYQLRRGELLKFTKNVAVLCLLAFFIIAKYSAPTFALRSELLEKLLARVVRSVMIARASPHVFRELHEPDVYCRVVCRQGYPFQAVEFLQTFFDSLRPGLSGCCRPLFLAMFPPPLF